MKRVLFICLRIFLLTSLYTVTTQVKNSKNVSLVDRSWRTANKDLREVRAGLRAKKPPRDPPEELPKQNCVCSKIYDPVCASNNESYYNLCLLECKVLKADNVTVIHQGNCIPFKA